MKCIIYKSTPAKELRKNSLDKMLFSSRSANEKNNITGCIFIDYKKIVQLIEGEEKALDNLYNRISKDKRHQGVETLLTKKLNKRIMEDWPMAVFNVVDKDKNESDINKLSLMENLHKSADIDIIKTVVNEILN